MKFLRFTVVTTMEVAMARQPGFFDLDERYRALSAAGDPLERLAAAVDLELFGVELEAALGRSDRALSALPTSLRGIRPLAGWVGGRLTIRC
jgi:hypothetical protein